MKQNFSVPFWSRLSDCLSLPYLTHTALTQSYSNFNISRTPITLGDPHGSVWFHLHTQSYWPLPPQQSLDATSRTTALKVNSTQYWVVPSDLFNLKVYKFNQMDPCMRINDQSIMRHYSFSKIRKTLSPRSSLSFCCLLITAHSLLTNLFIFNVQHYFKSSDRAQVGWCKFIFWYVLLLSVQSVAKHFFTRDSAPISPQE